MANTTKIFWLDLPVSQVTLPLGLSRFPHRLPGTHCLHTRGVQKVRRPTQLTTRYARHILSLFDIFSCNWNALGPGFLQSSHSAVEELLLLVFQPAICRADKVLVIRNVESFNKFFHFRKKNKSHLEPEQCTWSHVSSSTGCHPKCRLWTTPSPTIFTIRIRIARQMVRWKTKDNNSSTTESELWRNAGPGAF